MRSIKYHRIFEIRLLHEYYLLSATVPSFFELPKSRRDEILQERILKNQYRLGEDVQIEPTAECQRQLKNHQLQFLATSTGFAVASGAKPTAIAHRFQPNIELERTLKLAFILDVRNPNFKNYSSIPLQSALPTNYYFTNAATSVMDTATEFNALSQPVAPFEGNKAYEPGELAMFGTDLREATVNVDNQLFWKPIAGKGYCNENDRTLLPKVFNYPFKSTPPIYQVELTLEQLDGTSIKKITITQEKPIPAVRADFATSEDAQPIPDGHYILNITTNAGTLRRQIYLSDNYRRKAVGLIEIDFGQTATNGMILDNGLLQQPHPVFEIRFRSRATFWRYLPLFVGKKLLPENAVLPFFRQEGNSLVTVGSHRLTFLPTIQDNTGEIGKLPQPKPSPLRQFPDDLRWYSDIHVAYIKNRIK